MMKIWYGLLSGVVLAFSFSGVAIAEEVVVEEPTPIVEPAYTPPPEALEGVGGWAVVDPNTGNVHGVVVCTNDVCGPTGSWGGKMPVDYMGCSGCDLRFQTRATEDGNVAGWHGTQTNIDPDGNVSQSNDGSVKWNSSDNTFSIENQSVDESGSKIKRKQKLVPEKTATDGKNLQTGIEDIETSFESEVEGEKILAETVQDNYEAQPTVIDVSVENWRRFQYEGVSDLENHLGDDVEASFVEEGLVAQSIEEEGVDQPVESVEPPRFVKAVRELTERVVKFFSGWFSS